MYMYASRFVLKYQLTYLAMYLCVYMSTGFSKNMCPYMFKFVSLVS